VRVLRKQAVLAGEQLVDGSRVIRFESRSPFPEAGTES